LARGFGLVGLVAAPGCPLLAVATALLVVGLGIAAVSVGRLAEHEMKGGPGGHDEASSGSGRRAQQAGLSQRIER
jgi:hypothetical protein